MTAPHPETTQEGHGMKPTTTPLDVLLGENARTLFQEGVRAAVRVYREDLAEGGQLAAKAALVHALREETSHDTVLCMLAEAIHQLAQKDAR